MTTKDLIRATARKTKVKQDTTKAVLAAAVEVIAEALAAGDHVQIHDLGTIKAVERKSRRGYSFKAGAVDEIPTKHRVKLIPAKALRLALNRLREGSESTVTRSNSPVDAPGKD